MSSMSGELGHATSYPVDVLVVPAVHERNRLTTAFRPILALPHLVLVGGPIVSGLAWRWTGEHGSITGVGAGGVLGAAAVVGSVIAWFAILFTGRYPPGLWSLAALYLRWRVRAVAYMMLLRDEFPPFGDGSYPTSLELEPPDAPRDRLSVAFRVILALPQVLVVWALGIGWVIGTVLAWFAIVFTGTYPRGLYDFGVGVLRWSTRVEAYLLLLRDEYPPFSLA